MGDSLSHLDDLLPGDVNKLKKFDFIITPK